jgi:hypothetical protein
MIHGKKIRIVTVVENTWVYEPRGFTVSVVLSKAPSLETRTSTVQKKRFVNAGYGHLLVNVNKLF